MADKLKKTIMRRVYYAYTLRLATHTVTLHLALLVGSAFLMTQFVSFKNVLANVSNIKVGQLGSYTWSALVSTEIWTILLIGLIIFAALSLRIQLRPLSRGGSLASV